MNKSMGGTTKGGGWRSTIIFLVVIINLTLVFRLVWGEQSVAAWQGLKGTLADTQAELSALDLKRSELSREIRLLQADAAYVEKVIRQRLNYVRPGEILYLFDDLRPEESIWTGVAVNDQIE